MSLALRLAVVDRLVFQKESQRSDLLDPNLTQTELIAFLDYMTGKKGHVLEITAVRTDHHDDSGLGEGPAFYGTHARGWAIDCWPLNSKTPGDWTDPSTHDFRQVLTDAQSAPFFMQTGLAGNGSADPLNYAESPANMAAAGPSAYVDDGGPHCHFGTKET